MLIVSIGRVVPTSVRRAPPSLMLRTVRSPVAARGWCTGSAVDEYTVEVRRPSASTVTDAAVDRSSCARSTTCLEHSRGHVSERPVDASARSKQQVEQRRPGGRRAGRRSEPRQRDEPRAAPSDGSVAHSRRCVASAPVHRACVLQLDASTMPLRYEGSLSRQPRVNRPALGTERRRQLGTTSSPLDSCWTFAERVAAAIRGVVVEVSEQAVVDRLLPGAWMCTSSRIPLTTDGGSRVVRSRSRRVGKRIDLADGVFTGDQHHEAFHSDAQAAGGRHAVLQGAAQSSSSAISASSSPAAAFSACSSSRSRCSTGSFCSE